LSSGNGLSNVKDEVLNVWIPDPTQQETLQTENVPDPLANEQTFPTTDELRDVEGQKGDNNQMREVFRNRSWTCN
jgi:pre-rRNA-processing protein TSR1